MECTQLVAFFMVMLMMSLPRMDSIWSNFELDRGEKPAGNSSVAERASFGRVQISVYF